MDQKIFSDIRPENKAQFSNLLRRQLMLELRKEVALFILRNDEDDYFLLDTFYRKHDVYGNNEITSGLSSMLVEELHMLGWKTKIVHGGTSIYIFSGYPHKSDHFVDIIE